MLCGSTTIILHCYYTTIHVKEQHHAVELAVMTNLMNAVLDFPIEIIHSHFF